MTIFWLIDQSPPKRELKVSDAAVRDLSLYDLQLSPSSVLHIKFFDETLNREAMLPITDVFIEEASVDVDIAAPLSDFVLAQATDLPRPPQFDKESTDGAPSASRHQSSKVLDDGTSSGEKKVPKWLKLSSESDARNVSSLTQQEPQRNETSYIRSRSCAPLTPYCTIVTSWSYRYYNEFQYMGNS
jgi:hypothetical protein